MRTRRARWLVPLLLVTGLLVTAPVGTAQGAPEATQASLKPKFSNAVAFDTSPAMRDVAKRATSAARAASGKLDRPERGPAVTSRGYAGDGALQSAARATVAPEIAAPSVNFEGLRGDDNVPILGGIPVPPDPVGDVGPSQYVEMVNVVWAVYSKTGTRLLGPLGLDTIWAGFAVPDCED